MRTPKCEDPARLTQVLRVAWQETVLLIACLLAIWSMMTDRWYESPAIILWMIMLAVQGAPYAATVITAMLSALHHTRFDEAPALTAPANETKPILTRAA